MESTPIERNTITKTLDILIDFACIPPLSKAIVVGAQTETKIRTDQKIRTGQCALELIQIQFDYNISI